VRRENKEDEKVEITELQGQRLWKGIAVGTIISVIAWLGIIYLMMVLYDKG